MICDLSQGRLHNLAFDHLGRLRLQRRAGTHVECGEFLSPVMEIGAVAMRLTWRAQWTAPLRWRKHPGNPIYGPQASGPWDSWTNGVSIVPANGGRSYRMYYAGMAGEGIGFAVADVADPLRWTEHPASPVLLPRSDNWEGNQINQPRVVKVTETHWRMYYTGWGFDGPGTPWALGLAESFDAGLTWRRAQDDPIIPRGDRHAPDGAGACVPMVLRIKNRWMMWYTAGRVDDERRQQIHLCLATSNDGLQWEKYPGNPVLGDDFIDGAPRSVTSRCCVRWDEGVFRMWYSFAKPDYRIHYAESMDGIHWERAPIEPVLGPSPAPAWDDVMVEYPEVQVVDGVFRLWFCGNNYGSVGYAEGVPETRVDLYTRASEMREPETAWSDWQPATRGGSVAAGRFLQIKAVLHTEDPEMSPALNAIFLTDRGLRVENMMEGSICK